MNKYITIVIICTTSLSLSLFVGVVYFGSKGITEVFKCEDKIIKEVQSRFESQLHSKLIQTNCGATNSFTYQLTLANNNINKTVTVNKNDASEPKDINFTGSGILQFKEADKIISKLGVLKTV